MCIRDRGIRGLMEDLINDVLSKPIQYAVYGEGQQVLSMALASGRSVYAVDSSVVCCSEGLIRLSRGELLVPKHTKSAPALVKLLNASEGTGYIIINYKGGQILTLDAERMERFIFNKEYILACTENVSLAPHK
eukprot:TRINITY_DN15173_c0_g1_i2.p1 TRINITY_DN15173_c0_g1~~TRINITY_DN15173_c0_g1_i2.p1  ORF type:complete len:134 (-),score=19.54 TRINITY_DN15173_c0_g1_i2:559-960(-)